MTTIARPIAGRPQAMTAPREKEEQRPRRRSTWFSWWFTIMETVSTMQSCPMVEETRHLLLPRIG